MAPTLNSTLIQCGPSTDDRASPMVEETEKELSQYSPILARKAPSSPHPGRSKTDARSKLFTSGLDYASSHRNLNRNTTTSASTLTLPLQEEEINEIPIWICGQPRFVSGITNQTTCNNIIEALIEDELQALDGSDCRDAALSHDLRDYVITERWRDVEQPLPGAAYILPLWKAWGTKCATNEVKFKLRVNKWASRASHLDVQKAPVLGETARATQKEELGRRADKMAKIDRMMQKILKQGEFIRQHLSQLSDNQAEVQRIEKLCKKVRQTKRGKRILMEQFIRSTMARDDVEVDPVTLSSAMTSEDELFYLDPPILSDDGHEKQGPPKKADVDKDSEDDELFLVIDDVMNDDLDSGVHFDLNKRSKSQMTEMQTICSSVELTEVLLETPKRKKRVQRNFEDLRRHSLNQPFMASDVCEGQKDVASKPSPSWLATNPEFKRTSLQFDTIRREIIVKMNDLKELLRKEEHLIVNLEEKCQRYKRENEIYGRTPGPAHLKVDEIQDNLNRVAKEIVQHELDLYQTKLEIRENYLVLDDLKEMLAEKDPISGFGTSEFNRLVENKFGLRCPDNGTPTQQPPRSTTLPLTVTSPFVDNIHEFCDNNNDSIIV